jgi:hypothetical protein
MGALALKWLLGGGWLKALPWLLAAGLGMYAGTQRINYLECKADAASGRADREHAASDFTAADKAFAEKLVADYAGEIAELQGKYDDARLKLARTPSNPDCRNTPAARAFDDGLRELDAGSGGGDANGNRGAQTPVPKKAGATR